MSNKIPFSGSLWGSEVGNIVEVRNLTGHKTMNMTMRYAHLSQESKKKAVNLLNGLTAPTKKADSGNLVAFPKSSKITTDLTY